MVPWRPHKLRLFNPLLTPLFHEHSQSVFIVLFYIISEIYDTDFAGQVVYKPQVLSVSSKELVPIAATVKSRYNAPAFSANFYQSVDIAIHNV